MHENHAKLDRIGRAILASARNEIYLNMRFLDVALSGLDYAMNLNTPTIGTDGWSIQFNPRLLIELYQQDTVLLNRVYLHMLLHCLFRHPLHREGREGELWDLACDIAVESVLDSIDNRCVRLLSSNLREDTYDDLSAAMPVLTAEAIYRELDRRHLDFDIQTALAQEFRRDDHRFWPGDSDDTRQDGQSPADSPPNRDKLEEKWQQLSQKTQTGMETFFAQYGDEAGDVLKLLRIENRERYDYRSFLRRFLSLREEMRVDTDSFDYAYYALGLELYGNIPLIEPLEYRESRKIRDFAIVIDTSDSCAEGAIQRFLEETRAVLSAQELFFADARLHIIQADAEVQKDTVVHSADDFARFCEQFEVRGFGGTDFRPAFAYVDALMQEGALSDLRGLIYFTDGFGVYPQRKPGYDVAFVFFREDYTPPEVPGWAMKIMLEPESGNR